VREDQKFPGHAGSGAAVWAISDPGSQGGILDFGFWILDCRTIENPKSAVENGIIPRSPLSI
jgi:hypothetical protein